MDEVSKIELIKLAEKVQKAENDYLQEKHNLDILKAQFVLKNDWEKVLGKSKPTQKEKDAYIDISIEEKVNKVNHLKTEWDYLKRIYEISIVEQKY